MSLSSNFIQSV